MLAGDVVAELVGEVFGGAGGVGENFGEPVVFGVGVVEFYGGRLVLVDDGWEMSLGGQGNAEWMETYVER